MSEIFKNLGIEVKLKNKEDFNLVRKTLSRIGIASYNRNVLTQSCHIFHKRGQYAIMHFKELLAFDGKNPDIPDEDIARRNTIVDLLEQWNLVEVVENDLLESGPFAPMSNIMVVASKDKDKWTFVKKYTIGK